MSVSVVVVSKNEPMLADTLQALQEVLAAEDEVLVVDASAGALDDIRRAYGRARWIDFVAPPGVRISIPHQRNAGVAAARHDLIVFVDAGCVPRPGWRGELLAPLVAGAEDIVCGAVASPQGRNPYDSVGRDATYVEECPTINLAFRRDVFTRLGGFDEAFTYGSDVDFSWRAVDAGYRIRFSPNAVVEHHWGSPRRRLRRAYGYGRARVHLYRKHAGRRAAILRRDPIVIAYPLFLVGLPLALWQPAYLLALLVPLVHNRRSQPVRAVVNNLAFGAGVLRELARVT